VSPGNRCDNGSGFSRENQACSFFRFSRERAMEWKKPEFTVVAVTMEVTAYAAKK
jgi:coenzyme PQQ precursor peptide PqqA